MIHYMPFSYISERLIGILTGLLGPVSVCQPLDALIPDHMRAAAQTGMLQMQLPSEMDQDHLARAFNAFSDWADLHRGRTGDLTGFFRSEQGQAIWLQESVHNIRSQIRQAVGSRPSMASPLFQAALFQALAHRYDQQQDALSRELGAVASIEQRFGQILGEPPAGGTPIGPALVHGGAKMSDLGLYMTERRIVSWAHLAGSLAPAGSVFLTTSGAVNDFLLDRLPEALPVMQGYLDPVNQTAWDQLAEVLAALSQARHPQEVSTPNLPEKAEIRDGAALTVHLLAGCPSDQVIHRLMKTPVDPQISGSSAKGLPMNTVLVFLQLNEA